MIYQIVKKRGVKGRQVVLKTYETDTEARQYLEYLREEVFQKSIYAKTPEKAYHSGCFLGTLLTYYTPKYKPVWVYIRQEQE